MTVGFYVPSAIPRFDETIFSGGNGGIAENLGMVKWINSVQATRSYRPAAFSALILHVILAGDRRSGADDTQGGGNCKRDESHLSTHGFLLLPDADTDRI
jgi:hypothetical protein